MYVYNALCKSIFLYDLIIWGDCSGNAIKPHKIQQVIPTICYTSKEKGLIGLISLSYKELVRCKKAVFHYILNFKQVKLLLNKRQEYKREDLLISHTRKSIANKFLNYLGPKFF